MRSGLRGYSDNKTRYLSVLYTLLYTAAAYFVFFSFFENSKISVILTLCGLPVFIFRMRKYMRAVHRERVEAEFYIMLRQISMSLSSGSTIENAVRETVAADRKSYKVIGKELEKVYGMLRNNIPAERAFAEFAKQCGNSEITAFGEVLRAGIPAGINLAGLIRYVSSSLRMKSDVEQDIKRMLNAPKYNNRIIMAMPVFCIVLFRSISPSYLEPLYVGAGRIVMIAVLALIISAWLIGERLSDIRY